MKPLSLLPVLVVLLGLSIASFASGASHATDLITRSLSLSGEVTAPQTLSLEALRALPSHTFTNVTISTHHGSRVIKSLKGALLTDVLNKVRLAIKDRADTKRMFIVAIAADGYKALFSWNELFNSPLGDGVLVAYEKDGAEITDGEGELQLISSKDIATGPRYVKWLKSIDVRKIQ